MATPTANQNPSVLAGLRLWWASSSWSPSWSPTRLRHPWCRYAVACLVVLVAVAATSGIEAAMPRFRYHGVGGVLAVLCVALTWGPGPAVAGALLSSALLAYVAVPADGSNVAVETVGFVLSLLFALAIALLGGTVQARRRQILAVSRELMARAAELDTALEAIPDGVVVYDHAGRLVRMNAAARRLFVDVPDYFERSIDDRLVLREVKTSEGTPFPRDQAPLLCALQGKTVHGVVAQLRAADGSTAWTATSAAPIRAADGKVIGVVGSISDITALRALQDQQADLLRTLSHDLRSPLTSVLGQAELIPRYLEAGVEPDRLRSSARAIVLAAQRMDAMIRDLVDLARVESGQLRVEHTPVDLASFLADLVQRMVDDRAHARIRVEVAPTVPAVMADPDRLERVLTNLISNAFKYSDPATTVVIAARCAGNDVVVAVADRGAGISADDVPHIFDRYYRASATSKREGLGLGLYIARTLVEAMGGRIWVESAPGEGSTFSIALLAANAATQIASA